jgi:hypothetical protein
MHGWPRYRDAPRQQFDEFGNMGGKIGSRHVAIGSTAQSSTEDTVVIQHQHAVSGTPDVAFEACGTQSVGQLKRLHGIVRSVSSGATVGEGHRNLEQ